MKCKHCGKKKKQMCSSFGPFTSDTCILCGNKFYLEMHNFLNHNPLGREMLDIFEAYVPESESTFHEVLNTVK